MAIYTKNTYTQADGDVEVATPSFHDSALQVSFATDSTAGTLEVYAKYHPDAYEEAVLDEDGSTAMTIDLTALETFQFYDKWVYSLIFKPTGVDASYTVCLASGEMYRTRKA